MKRILFSTIVGLLFVAGSSVSLEAQVGRVSGTVVDEEGNPLQGVTIRIEGLDIRRNYKLKTNKDGKFLHAGVVLQGRYRVVAEKEGYRSDYVEGVKPGFSGEEGKVDFTLKKGTAGVLAFEVSDEERAEIEKQNEEAEKARQQFALVKAEFDAGLAAYEKGDFELAREKFQSAAEKDASQSAVWANLANTQAKLGQNNEAIASYQRAISLDTQNASLYQNLANAYAALGDTDNAKANYEKAATLGAADDPTTAAVTYYNMGVTYINEGNNKEAAEALLKSLEYDESYAESHYQLGLTMLGLNDLAGALQHLKRYVELAPAGANAETAKALISQLEG